MQIFYVILNVSTVADEALKLKLLVRLNKPCFEEPFLFVIKALHENISFSCNQCDFKAKRSNNLRLHIRITHEGFRFPCRQCNVSYKSKLALQKHNQKTHENKIILSFSWNQCDSKFREKKSLSNHKEAAHEGKRYPCTQCNYMASSHWLHEEIILKNTIRMFMKESEYHAINAIRNSLTQTNWKCTYKLYMKV